MFLLLPCLHVVALCCLVFYCGLCVLVPFAANPIPAVTEFVAQLVILELLDNVCILNFSPSTFGS